MQKKINLLATLLVIAIVLGGLSTCTRGSFRTGWESERDEMPEFAVNTGLDIVARDNFYPQTLVNTKTGEQMQVSARSVVVGMNKMPDDVAPESRGGKVLHTAWYILMFIVCLGGPIAFVLLLFVLITSIKSGGIFLKGNEKILRWMGGILLGWYALGWVETLSAFFRARELVKLEDYLIVFDAPNVYPLVLGVALLFFAQIFAKGRKMEEDQQFMV